MAFTYNGTKLGIKKDFTVKTTNRLMRDSMKLQKSLTKMSIEQANTPETEEAAEKQIDMVLDVQEQVIAYIVDTLKLNKKQAEAIDEMEFGETMTVASEIMVLAQGGKLEDLSNAPEDKDPKD